MSKGNKSLLNEKDLKFFAKISASISHEINNVFSVINENSGLLSDLLIRAENGHELDTEKLKRTNDTIQNHLNRGKTIVKRLNRFSHSADDPLKDFDLREVLENLIAITRRFTYQKKVDLEINSPEEPVTIKNNPFALQQAVFNSIAMLLNASEPKDSIVIDLAHSGSRAIVSINGFRPIKFEDGDDEMSSLSNFMEELEGEVKLDSDRRIITLMFPRSISRE